MTKSIIQALIVAFLLFLIPLIYNSISRGGVIRLLGGVTQKEFGSVVRDGDVLRLHLDSDTRHVLQASVDQPFDVRVQDERLDLKQQQWVVSRVKKP